MNHIWRDVLFGARLLVRRPWFALIAIVTLALGIAANTAVFSVVHTLLLKPLAVKEPDRLVGLYRKIPESPAYNRFSYPNYLDVKARTKTLSEVAAYYFIQLNLGGAGQTERIQAKLATASYFEMLGAPMSAGRAFTEQEDMRGGGSVAVISHGLWKRRFGSDPASVGSPIILNGQPFTVIGIAAREFTGTEIGQSPDVWVPISTQPSLLSADGDWLSGRGMGWLRVVGRLAPGVDFTQARAELESIGAALRQEHPRENEAFGIATIASFGLHPQVRGLISTFVLLLLGVVGLVLLIACANIAGLLLARGVERRREIGIRMALGARRARLVGQFLAEGLPLAMAGGGVGLLITPWLIAGIDRLQATSPLPTRVELSLDYGVMMFATLLSLSTTLLFGLAPALGATGAGVSGALKEGSAGARTGHSRMRQVLVAGQVALCLVLLAGAGLFVRSFQQAGRIDPGFDPENLSVLSFDLGLQGYDTARATVFHRELLERAAALPGVESVALAGFPPLTTDTDTTVQVDGYTPPDGQRGTVVNFNYVTPGYLSTLGIPIVKGRNFAETDGKGAPGVIIVNETAARMFWPGRDPIGRTVRWSSGAPAGEVIGVAADSKYVTLGEAPRPFLYMSMLQRLQPEACLHVRTRVPPATVIRDIQAEFARLDKDLPLFGVSTMGGLLDRALTGPRVAATLLGLLGGVALLLSLVGVYGMMALSVGGRTGEFGIRMALGARGGDIVRMVLRQGLRVIALGIVLGLALAAAATRLLGSFLYGVSPSDPAAFVAAVALMAGAALVACWLPARRAARVDPMTALRYE